MAMWKGNWIWFSGEQTPKNFYLYVRKIVDLPEEPCKAPAKVCADSRYKLFVNGELIGRGPTRSFPEYQHYDEYDISGALRKGKNVIAALVHHFGESTFQYHLGRGAFLFDAQIECPNSEMRVYSDDTWKVLPAEAWYRDLPRITIQLGFQEIYDANKAPKGWTGVDFDDSAWENATVVGPVGTPPWKLIPREITYLPEFRIYPHKVLETGAADTSGVQLPPDDPMNISLLQQDEVRDRSVTGLFDNVDSLARHPQINDLLASEYMKPGGEPASEMDARCAIANAALKETMVRSAGDGRSSYVVLDFGKEVMGYVSIKVRSEGGIVDLGYTEIIENGIANSNRSGVRYADRVVLEPGVTEFQTFDKRAFRYMQIDFRDLKGPAVIEYVGLDFSTYPVKWRGNFRCSDARLNDIWDFSVYTVQLNMEDAYTDCPWRERAQWMGDARVEALVNYYAFGDLDLAKVMLNEIARSQHEDGITDCFAPGDMGPCVPIPSFCLIWILSTWDYYMFSGDKEQISRLYPNVKKALKWFTGYIGDMGLATHMPYWMFIDWAGVDIRGAVTTLNCFLVAALRNTASMAEVLGKDDDAKDFRKTANSIAQAINTHLIDDEKGVYVDCHCDGEKSSVISEQSNSLAVLYDVAPRDRWNPILDYIHNPDSGVVRAGSPYFSFYVLQALWKAGQHARALNYIRERWGYMLDQGATTCWEQWNNENSLCHGWSGGPGLDLPAQILGVRPAAPGFERVEISPIVLNLDWAECTVPTIRGDICVRWERGETFVLSVDVPGGVTAEIKLPYRVPVGEISINGKRELPDSIEASTSEELPVFRVRGKIAVTFACSAR